MAELAARIEALLLSRQGWVSGDEIAAAFGIDKRQLRAANGRPGLCAKFAIASTASGFKHLRWATQEEIYHAYQQRRKHGIGELVSARQMLRSWKSFAQPVQALPRLTGEGQGMLF